MTNGWPWCWLVAALVIVGPAGAEQLPPHRLADQAFHLLREHCYKCHGPSPEPQGGVRVFDLAQLLAKPRSLIVSQDPKHSSLVLRIQSGSMPPGKLPKVVGPHREVIENWVQAGAPAFYGPAFVFPHLLDDVRRLPKSERPFVRYLSLDHLLSGPDPIGELSQVRKTIEETLQHLAGERKGFLTPVGDAGILYRIDLRQLGWDRRPFQAGPLNLFDLLLLEYPFAELPVGSEKPGDPIDDLRREYLSPAEMVRPIPYVRGDWLAVRATMGPFIEELKRKTSDVPLPNEVETLRKGASRTPPGFRPGVFPFDTVALVANNGTHEFDLEFKTDKMGNVFKTGQPIEFRIDNPTRDDLWVAVVYTDSTGVKRALMTGTKIPAGDGLIMPPKGKKYSNDTPGTDFVTVYTSRQTWDAGKVIRAEGFRDRFVNPVYALDQTGKPTNPVGMQVKSFALKIVE